MSTDQDAPPLEQQTADEPAPELETTARAVSVKLRVPMHCPYHGRQIAILDDREICWPCFVIRHTDVRAPSEQEMQRRALPATEATPVLDPDPPG